MADYAWVENQHGSNTYSFYQENNTANLLPSETYEGYVNDEIRDTFLANLVGQPSCVLRQQMISYGEEKRLGRASYTVSGNVDELAASVIVSAADLFLTGSGLLPSLDGIAGGYDGRVLRIWNKSSVAVTLNHLAGSPTPAGSRMFVNNVLGLSLGAGVRVEAYYHGGDSLWYVG